jgi:ParB-like nuclease domain
MPPHTASKSQPQASFDWRAHLAVHNACKLFPLLPETELKELAENIRTNGLRVPIVACASPDDGGHPLVLDGRNRLDALAQLGLLYETDDHQVGLRTWTGEKWAALSGDKIHFEYFRGDDPHAFALSLNIHRRHLTREQKRELIAELVKAKPGLSDRQLGEMAKASKNTIAAVRTDMEARGQVGHVEVRADTKGRRQPAKKRKVVPSGTAAEPTRHKAVSAKDIAVDEFDVHVLRLVQMIRGGRKPERFAKTSVSTSDLSSLGRFLAEVAEAVKAAAAAEGTP